MKRCQNTLATGMDSQPVSEGGTCSASGGHVGATASVHMSSSELGACSVSVDNVLDVSQPSVCDNVNELLIKAYGAPLIQSDGGARHSLWCQRWSTVVQNLGRHYALPTGSVGRRYVDTINLELQHFLICR